MSGQYYKIKYGSMDQFYSMVGTAVSNWYKDLEELSKCYNRIIEMDSFQSASAESVKSYLQEVHGVLLYAIQQVLSTYQAQLLLYKSGFYGIDSDIYSTIPEEVLTNVCNKLNKEVVSLCGISDSISGSINSVSDIIYLINPTKDNLQIALEGLKNELTNYRDCVDSYETNQYNSYKSTLQSALDALQVTVNDYLYNGTNIANYQMGAISSNPNMLDLYQKVQVCAENTKQNSKAIEDAAELQMAAYEQMQADYEAACEARKDEGIANIIMGGVTIVAGTLAIVCTAGMATPIVVTAAVSGSCTIAYGVSNTVEGAQDVYYGSVGDLDSAAINPIRDTVFVGNQGLYDAWGSLSMTVAGLCVPVGQAVNGMAGASTSMLAKTSIKVVAKEVAKDTVMDYASESITNYAAQELALNKTQSTILNLTLSTALDKGSDWLGDTVSGNKGASFTDGMSYEDAKRYNAYWDGLENGSHNHHPGLSSEDIRAWDFANSKVNEHVAVSKVSKEIADLRIKEVEIRNKFQNEGGSDVIDNIITDGSHLDNGKLKPNVTYKTGEHDYIYKTNEDGLIVNASTDNLQLKTHEGRLNHNPNTYGKETGDHAGHLFGDRFGGSPELDNLVSQAKNVNLSEFKVIENQWAKALENGQKVTVDIDINYDVGGTRPISFDVSYTIDDVFYYQKIYN